MGEAPPVANVQDDCGSAAYATRRAAPLVMLRSRGVAHRDARQEQCLHGWPDPLCVPATEQSYRAVGFGIGVHVARLGVIMLGLELAPCSASPGATLAGSPGSCR